MLIIKGDIVEKTASCVLRRDVGCYSYRYLIQRLRYQGKSKDFCVSVKSQIGMLLN